MKARFVQCRDACVGHLMRQGVEVAALTQEGGNLTLNQNALCAKALEIGADYLFHVETDVLFPVDAPLRLAAFGKDVAGVTTAYKDQARPRAMGRELDESQIECGSTQTAREVMNLPTGAMLIARRVLEAMPSPIFRWGFDEARQSDESPDINFCRRARETGFSIWLDPKLSLECGHIGSFVYGLRDADAE